MNRDVSKNKSHQGCGMHNKFEYDVLVNWCFFCCTHPSLSARYRKVVNWYKRIPPVQTSFTNLVELRSTPRYVFLQLSVWLISTSKNPKDMISFGYMSTKKLTCTEQNLTKSGTRTCLVQMIKWKHTSWKKHSNFWNK